MCVSIIMVRYCLLFDRCFLYTLYLVYIFMNDYIISYRFMTRWFVAIRINDEKKRHTLIYYIFIIDNQSISHAFNISFAGACAPVAGSYQSYTHVYVEFSSESLFVVLKTNVPPWLNPCSRFGGIHGFHRINTEVNSPIFPVFTRSTIEYGVDWSNKVSFNPQFNFNASYATFSASAYNTSFGNSFSSQKSFARSRVPIETQIKFTLLLLQSKNFGNSSFLMIWDSSQQKNHPNERIRIKTL